tara:strand:+ start:249 stop:440 length:192 start_codon:yes stop_codon:yes gene_type:complete
MRRHSPNPKIRKKIHEKRDELDIIDLERPKSPDPQWDRKFRKPVIEQINKLLLELSKIEYFNE